MALSGLRLIVGDPLDDTGPNGAGSVYIYDLGSATPTTPVVTLYNPRPAPSGFGPVGISGTQVVVGGGADDSGGAYGYELSSATPTTPVATFNSPGPASGDVFGNSLAISGSYLLVGALRDATGAELAGSAYAYDLSTGTPTAPIATFHNPSPAASDYFGNSVAISGPTLVIGAPGDGTDPSQPGSAYVYDLSSATPTVPTLSLDNPGLSGSVHFGYSVAIAGARVVVGVYGDDTGALGAGRAYVYDITSATPTAPVFVLDNPNPSPFDGLGYPWRFPTRGLRLAFPGLIPGATNAGRVYVFDLNSATPTQPVVTLNNPSAATDDQFGFHVAIFGTRVVVGAVRDDTGATDAGTAYVYDLSSSSTPTVPVATINHPRPAAGDNFAFSVAIDGATVAMGAPFAETPGADEGNAYVFSSDADGDGLLDGWEIAHFGTTAGHGAQDDSDDDGRNELVEEAFDTDPTRPDGGTPIVANEGGFLTLTLTKHAGATYLGQSAATPESAAFSPTTTTVLLDNASTLKVRDNFPASAGGQRFLRVKVTAAP